MNRKIIFNLAMSVDGYIADENGGYAWITGDGNKELDTQNKWDYDKFLAGIDVVVMGKNCYDQNMHTEFKDKKVFVATSKSLADYDNIHFIHGDICKAVLEEKQKDGGNIFLFGGGILVDAFIKADIIDEYIIGIIPTVLGKGRPLFLGDNPTINLNLEDYFIDQGIAILRYAKRNETAQP